MPKDHDDDDDDEPIVQHVDQKDEEPVEEAVAPPKMAVVEHVRKTKEQMMHEPLPLFDCMYCAKNSSHIFKMVSENFLREKYSSTRGATRRVDTK